MAAIATIPNSYAHTNETKSTNETKDDKKNKKIKLYHTKKWNEKEQQKKYNIEMRD